MPQASPSLRPFDYGIPAAAPLFTPGKHMLQWLSKLFARKHVPASPEPPPHVAYGTIEFDLAAQSMRAAERRSAFEAVAYVKGRYHGGEHAPEVKPGFCANVRTFIPTTPRRPPEPRAESERPAEPPRAATSNAASDAALGFVVGAALYSAFSSDDKTGGDFSGGGGAFGGGGASGDY